MNDRVIKMPHSIIVEDRKKMTVSGVSNVESFDEQSVILNTDLGEMTVRGDSLSIGKLNTETGEVAIAGNINALAYTNDSTSTGFFSKLFK